MMTSHNRQKGRTKGLCNCHAQLWAIFWTPRAMGLCAYGTELAYGCFTIGHWGNTPIFRGRPGEEEK